METINYKIFTELDEIKTSYEGNSLSKIEGLTRSQYKVIKMCEFYSDSKYLGTYIGNVKQLGSGSIDIPFCNIVNYRVALAKTATDLDIKDIQIVADHPNFEVHSMVLNREVYEWMKSSNFSKTLNEMGLTRPKYGGYLVKKCVYNDDGEDELEIEVVRWTNVWTDQNDILGGTIVELQHMSPVELNSKKDVWKNTEDVLKAFKKIKAADRPTSIDVYEATGEMPKSFFKQANDEEITDADEYEYSLQRHFVADIDGKKYLLYSEELKGELCDYYEYLSWEDNGYGLGRGVIEDSEEAQVWTNDAVINESIAMSLAGRVGIITNSKKIGNNILEHDHGKVYEIEDNKTATPFNFAPSALGQYQNIIERWKLQADNVTSSFNAVTGEQPPSGTPYSQTALLNQVATKPFDYKREEWGIHLVTLFNKWSLPFLIKRLYKKHILVSDFTDDELDVIDESFAAFNSNKQIIADAIQGKITTPEMQGQMMVAYKQHIKKSGKKRYLEIPKGYFDDIECKITVLTTGEQKNKAVILQSLSTLLKDVQASFNPNTGEYGVLKDPTLSKIFKEAVELAGTGISPVSLGKSIGAPQAPQAPQPAPAVPSPMSGMSINTNQ